MKIVFFGDIVGRVGREGVKKVLPEVKRDWQPDIIIANAENLAHGTGITHKVIEEMRRAGVDLFTSGNHAWDKPLGEELLQDKNPIVLRPANYGARKSGVGHKVVNAGGKKLLVINLQGQVHMKDEVDNPFITLDTILADISPASVDAIMVDIHAEVTSEKTAMGWHADGRASFVVGTHTHVPTADARILPGGTAYLTDVGMSGARHSVIGVEKEPVLRRFLGQEGGRFEYAEEGVADVNAVLVEVGDDRRAIRIDTKHWIVET